MNLTYEQFQEGLIRLMQEGGLTLPFGITPGDTPAGDQPITNEAEWNAYQWNPPQGHDDLEADPLASDKPSWQEIVDAYQRVELDQFRERALALVDDEAERRIMKNFGAKNFRDEVYKRLRGDTTKEQDDTAAYMRQVHQALRDEVQASRTLQELESVNITSDSTWSV